GSRLFYILTKPCGRCPQPNESTTETRRSGFARIHPCTDFRPEAGLTAALGQDVVTVSQPQKRTAGAAVDQRGTGLANRWRSREPAEAEANAGSNPALILRLWRLTFDNVSALPFSHDPPVVLRCTSRPTPRLETTSQKRPLNRSLYCHR